MRDEAGRIALSFIIDPSQNGVAELVVGPAMTI